MANRDNLEIVVKVRLTVEEFVAFKHVAEEMDASQSALARWLIRNEISRFHNLTIRQGNLFDKRESGPQVGHKSKGRKS